MLQIDIMDPQYGADFEGSRSQSPLMSPKGHPLKRPATYIALFTLFNDITFRESIKTELPTMFGFLQSKPNSSFAPIVVTPDELGKAWDGKRIHGPIKVEWNGQLFGQPDAAEMHFTMGDLIANRRRYAPDSPPVALSAQAPFNADAARGFACLTEARFQRILDVGAQTPG
jgi:fumarylacetoacetate (FAA) hydrolase